MAYEPIQDYGIIGDLRTAALISRKGSIDWLCLPRFDSPSVFGALLDDEKGGRFRISTEGEGVNYKQFYWPDTNVLITRHLTPDGVGEITDFMPVSDGTDHPEKHRLVRLVTVVRGSMRFRVDCRPAFNYARESHQLSIAKTGATFHSPSMILRLSTTVPLRDDGRAGVTGEFILNSGESCVFLLHRILPGEEEAGVPSADDARAAFEETVKFWRSWLAHCTYKGRWREMVQRSALVLKLLTYEPTGAIVAAPTCSLPESVGGPRNWDYRYSWIRDAAFTLYSLLRIGFTEEATQFIGFLDARCHELKPDGALQTVYGIDGRHELKEEILDHWEGYRGSRPVRIGNAAYGQRQLDIYGELMDSLYLYNKHVTPISNELWVYLRRLTNWVCRNWRKPDNAIWEVRGGRRQFVYSKLMCWVAIDRAWRLAEKRSFPADRALWKRTRDQIYTTIMKHGWSEKRQAFVQYFGSDAVDASN